jgi:hypothetical protein
VIIITTSILRRRTQTTGSKVPFPHNTPNPKHNQKQLNLD